MKQLNRQATALSVGLFLSVLHAAWCAFVAAGVGQALFDFVFWAHMIHVQYIVGPFDLTAALALIVLTFVVGCVFGWLFALVWNWLHRED